MNCEKAANKSLKRFLICGVSVSALRASVCVTVAMPRCDLLLRRLLFDEQCLLFLRCHVRHHEVEALLLEQTLDFWEQVAQVLQVEGS